MIALVIYISIALYHNSRGVSKVRASLDGNSPIFQQIKEVIEEGILSGEFVADEQIPSSRQLVSLYNVNPLTVLKGVGLLADEGILYKKRGEGMFVSSEAVEKLRRRIGQSFRREHIEPIVRVSASLGIGLDELKQQITEAWEEIEND
jgi:DNA-binding transcriptional regulator YhcF (GntR family)